MHRTTKRALQLLCSQSTKLNSRIYSKGLIDRGSDKEKIHFLKLEREQLKKLLKKLNKNDKALDNKLSELDKKIEKMEKDINEMEKDDQNFKMWNCLKCYRVGSAMKATSISMENNKMERSHMPQALRKRQLCDNKRMEEKNTFLWSKQVDELIKKRDLLRNILEDVGKQEVVVNRRLRENKKKLYIAEEVLNNIATTDEPPAQNDK